MSHRRVVMALLVASAALAQETRIEVQQPLDRQDRVLELSRSLRRDLDLFPEVTGFRTARLFRGQDSTWTLEISFERQGMRAHERRLLSVAAVDSLRGELELRLQRLKAASLGDPASRGRLVAHQFLLSVVFYGPAMPTILGLPGGRPSVGCYMVTAGAGFYLPYRLTRNAGVTPAQRQLAAYGAHRGIGAGLLAERLLLPRRGTERTALASAMAGSTGGALAGYLAAGRRSYTAGQGELCSVLGDVGIVAALGGGYLAGLHHAEINHRRLGDALALTGGGLGVVAGDRLGQRRDYTDGDAYVLRAGGMLGAVMSVPLVRLSGTDHAKAYVGGSLAGMGTGLVATDRALQGQEFSWGHGALITAGELAGGLVGLGLCYLADAGDSFPKLAYMGSGAAGSLLGFTFTFRAFSR